MTESTEYKYRNAIRFFLFIKTQKDDKTVGVIYLTEECGQNIMVMIVDDVFVQMSVI